MAQLNSDNQVKSISDMPKDEISMDCHMKRNTTKKNNNQQNHIENINDNLSAIADLQIANKYNVQCTNICQLQYYEAKSSKLKALLNPPCLEANKIESIMSIINTISQFSDF